MGKARIKTAAQWLVGLLTREALREVLHWVFNLLKQVVLILWPLENLPLGGGDRKFNDNGVIRSRSVGRLWLQRSPTGP